MVKPNAYAAFVREVARRRGLKGNYSFLFKELDQEWSSLSAEEKQVYKDRASNPPGTHKWSQDTKPPTLAIEGPESSANPELLAIKYEPNKAIDDRTVAVKRPHEDDAMAVALPTKKHAPGIPNWRTVKYTVTTQPKRYLDEPLLAIRNKCLEIVRSRERTLITMPIYSFSANVSCKHKKNDEEIFVPIEVSIYAYSLKEGRLAKPYHVFIDAGPIPVGCFNPAMDHAENHKITLPPKKTYPDAARNDYKKIYKEMLDYTKGGERTILVADHRDLAQATGCLAWLYKKACEDGSRQPGVSTWTVLPVIEFIGSMYNFVYKDMLMHNEHFFALYYWIKMQLENTSLDYSPSLMCEYHQIEGNETQWCTRSCAMKTFMNIESILDDIYTMYQAATKPVTEPLLQNMITAPREP